MTKKRTSLEDVLPSNQKTMASSTANGNSQAKDTGKRPHVKQQALYLKHPIHRQLRILAFEEDVKMHDLFLEAIDMLFKQRGLPSITECLGNETDRS